MKANGIGLSSLESPIRYYFDIVVNACDRLIFYARDVLLAKVYAVVKSLLY